MEGPHEYHAWANRKIGSLVIKGSQISQDLIRGMDLDLTFEMSESRDLTVRAYVDGPGDEFSDVFSGQERHVESSVLEREVWHLEARIESEIAEAEKAGDAESAVGLKRLVPEVVELTRASRAVATDDVTDDRFKLEDRKQQVAQQVWSLTSSKRVDAARSEVAVKKELDLLVQDNATDGEKQQYREVVDREKAFLDSSNPERIEHATAELERLRWQILFRIPKFLVEVFNWLQERSPAMNDAGLAKQLFESGRRAIDRRAWDELGEVNQRLVHLLPSLEREAAEGPRGFTNIVSGLSR